jgi:rubrerythrin
MQPSELLQQAIKFEEEAFAFYDVAARTVKSEQAKTMLKELAQEEAVHKAKLEDVLKKGVSWAKSGGKPVETVNLHIGDFLLPAKITDKADIQDALNVAIKREQASYDFYSSMAKSVSTGMRKVFDFLATEELKHKNKVENIYDQVVYQQN